MKQTWKWTQMSEEGRSIHLLLAFHSFYKGGAVLKQTHTQTKNKRRTFHISLEMWNKIYFTMSVLAIRKFSSLIYLSSVWYTLS